MSVPNHQRCTPRIFWTHRRRTSFKLYQSGGCWEKRNLGSMSDTAIVPPSLATGPTGMAPGQPLQLAQVLNTFTYKGVPMSTMFTPEDMEAIYDFDVREDDIILATFPKCGTHWMWEIIGLIQNEGVALTSEERLKHMSGLLELPIPDTKLIKGYQILKDKKAPRVYVTHLPIQFLPNQIWQKKPKIVYVCRNPKDCVVSMYNLFTGAPGAPSWNETYDSFITGQGIYGFFWSHALGYWKHRDDDNFLFVRFEDLKKHTTDCVIKVAAHLNHPLSSEAVNNVVKHSSVQAMKAAYAKAEEELEEVGKLLTRALGVFPFINKGNVGGWKTLFTVAQNERLEQVHEEQLKGSGLEFQFAI